jgi:hypothetical protein
MYAVVGCGRCGAFWVVEDRPETTACPRCSRRHRYDALKRFAETDTAEAAREARFRILQERGGVNADLDSFTGMASDAMEAGVDDDEYLAASGVDPGEVSDAGEPDGATGSGSKRKVVMAGLRELDEPTAADLAAYAADHGVEAEYVERALSKLRHRGVVSETGGRYRLL